MLASRLLIRGVGTPVSVARVRFLKGNETDRGVATAPPRERGGAPNVTRVEYRVSLVVRARESRALFPD